MAKFELKFLDFINSEDFIKINVDEENKLIEIYTASQEQSTLIVIDKSTAIKLSKTLRTEINKIKDPNHVIDYVELFKDKIENVIHIPDSNSKKGGKNG
jgi:hypothetical protein